MSLEGELEWEPVDTSAVESAEAREFRERETQQDIQRSKTGAQEDTRPVGTFMPETRGPFRSLRDTGDGVLRVNPDEIQVVSNALPHRFTGRK